MKMIFDLEKKLSDYETNLLVLRENEVLLKKELTNTKNELMTIKMDHEQLVQMKNMFLNRKSMISRKSLLNFNVNSLPLEKFQELQTELENKEKLITQLKESSVETVLEKEKIIYELQTKLQESERNDLRIKVEQLENKLILMEEELIKAQNALVDEKTKKESENSANFNKNLHEIINAKSKETQALIDMITDQDEKSMEMNKKLNEFQDIIRKHENEIKSSQSKIEALKNEKKEFLNKINELEQKLIIKEKECIFLQSELKNHSKTFEIENTEIFEQLSLLREENKKQNKIINEIKSQNKILKEKNSQLNENLENSAQKYENDLDMLKKQCSDKETHMEQKPKISQFKASLKMPISKDYAHKRTLSQELGSNKLENLFSFIDNNEIQSSPQNLQTKIRFSVSLAETENFLTSIKTEKESLISQNIQQLGFYPDIKVSQNAIEERLSTVEDHQSSDNNNCEKNDNEQLKDEASKKSISSHDEEENEELEEIKIELEEYEKENLLLRKENESMKNELKSLNEKFVKELEVSQKRESQILSDLQKQRKEGLLNLQISSKENKENNCKSKQAEISRLETTIKTLQIQFDEEKKFWENELKEVERRAIDAKMKYAQIMTERDVLELKCKQLQQRKELAPKLTVKKKTVFDFLFCNESN